MKQFWIMLAGCAVIVLALMCWLALQMAGWTSSEPSALMMEAPQKPLAARMVEKSPVKPLRAVRPAPAPSQKDRLLAALRRQLKSRDAIANEAVLKFKTVEAMRDFMRRARLAKLTVLGKLDALKAARVRFDQLEDLGDAINDPAGLEEDLGANYVVEVPRLLSEEDRPDGSGTAPFGDSFLKAIGANGDRSGWGQGVTVAVVDTGVENHPTFAEGQITHVDLVNDGQPFDGHGTAMASLIAGQDPEAPGVAPASHILDMRVADGQGFSDSFTLANGIVQAANSGAQIINVSLGSYGDAQVVRDAVAYALSRGATVIAAAGNDSTSNQLSFPAAINEVVSVGGVDAKLQQAYFSNSGRGLDLTAPAVGIQSGYGKDLIILGDGTSEATALASGVAAVDISKGATTPGGVGDLLKQTAMPLNLPPERGGAGMVKVR